MQTRPLHIVITSGRYPLPEWMFHLNRNGRR